MAVFQKWSSTFRIICIFFFLQLKLIFEGKFDIFIDMKISGRMIFLLSTIKSDFSHTMSLILWTYMIFFTSSYLGSGEGVWLEELLELLLLDLETLLSYLEQWGCGDELFVSDAVLFLFFSLLELLLPRFLPFDLSFDLAKAELFFLIFFPIEALILRYLDKGTSSSTLLLDSSSSESFSGLLRTWVLWCLGFFCLRFLGLSTSLGCSSLLEDEDTDNCKK